jgi:hypothetical protein
MRIFAVSLIVLALAACGGQDRGAGEEPAAVGSGAALDPAVQDCLDLVSQARFSDALPVCTKAAESYPANAEVTAALEQAKQQVAASAAGEAAEGLIEGARD